MKYAQIFIIIIILIVIFVFKTWNSTNIISGTAFAGKIIKINEVRGGCKIIGKFNVPNVTKNIPSAHSAT